MPVTYKEALKMAEAMDMYLFHTKMQKIWLIQDRL